MERADAVVIGAGVIGLAIARALAAAGREVLVIEAENNIGSGISSRNSEVIHAGIYYPKDSRKASLCVTGREKLYRFCEERGVAHRRCGKLIVAAEAQVPQLHDLKRRALVNGVNDVELLSQAELGKLEPQVRGTAALLSPSTGIIDSHGLMLALQADIEARGGVIACSSTVQAGERIAQGMRLSIEGAEPFDLEAGVVVNSTGIGAQDLSQRIRGLPIAQIPRSRLAKGSYFMLQRQAPFRRLIYPVPEPGGLGIHATLDLQGRVRFGPDVEWVDTPDYAVTEERSARFYSAVRRYWPDLEDGTLSPGYAGVRPKVVGPGEPDGDFVLHGPDEHDGAAWIALYGIESPGLTACLSIADEVVELSRRIH